MTRDELLALPPGTAVRVKVGPKVWDGVVYARSRGVVSIRVLAEGGKQGALIEPAPEDVTRADSVNQQDLFGS